MRGVRDLPRGGGADAGRTVWFAIETHDGETSEFKRQTDDYARAWAQAGHDGAVISMPTKNHFDLALSLMEPGGALAAAVVARIGARAA